MGVETVLAAGVCFAVAGVAVAFTGLVGAAFVDFARVLAFFVVSGRSTSTGSEMTFFGLPLFLVTSADILRLNWLIFVVGTFRGGIPKNAEKCRDAPDVETRLSAILKPQPFSSTATSVEETKMPNDAAGHDRAQEKDEENQNVNNSSWRREHKRICLD